MPTLCRIYRNWKSVVIIHFARHIEDIALAPLPREIESEDGSEAKSEANPDDDYTTAKPLKLVGHNLDGINDPINKPSAAIIAEAKHDEPLPPVAQHPESTLYQ
jgi:hypothetical protein